MAYGFRRIGVVDSIPAAGVLPGTGAALLAYRAELGSVLEITAKATAPSAGTLTLLRWFPPPQPDAVSTVDPAGEWRPWREDSPIVVLASLGTVLVSGRYEQADDSIEYWLLMGSISYGGPSPVVVADAQCVYYRGRK